MCIEAWEQGLMNQVHGVLLRTLLGLFGVDKSSSSHTANDKNSFFVLGKRPIKGSIGATKKPISINFSKAKIKFCFSLHLVFLLLTENKSISLEQIMGTF